VTVVRSGFVSVPGAQLWFDDRGTGPPVVFTHAGIADHRMWDAQLAAFSAGHRVVRWDLRTYGGSTNDATPYSTRADLLAVLDHVGIDRATFIGCSIGGGLTLSFAIEHPDRVAALVLIAPGVAGVEPPEWPEEAALDTEEQRLEAASDWAGLADFDVRTWVDGVGQPEGRAPAAVRELVRVMDLDHYQARHPSADHLPMRPPAGQRLGEVVAPTLLLIGDLDTPPCRFTVDALAIAIPGANVHPFPNAAHLPSMECAAEFARVVLDFLGPLGL
jgi:3-oxoadipate enol-lactonase